jgi:beta-lactamase regulating signal transducer with metallopeptidase domain
MPGIVVSLLLIAVGAILKVGVSVQSSVFDLNAIGMILIIVGIIGAVFSVLYEFLHSRRRTVREEPVEREVVSERDGV